MVVEMLQPNSVRVGPDFCASLASAMDKCARRSYARARARHTDS